MPHAVCPALRNSLLLAAWRCAACAASAQITYTPVIAPGQPAPGSPGAFNGPQPPVCQAYGKAALNAFLIGTPNPGLDNQGVWQASAGLTTLVARTDAPLPSTGAVKVAAVSYPTQSRSGGVVFAGALDFLAVGGTSDRCLFYSPGGLAQIAVREGDAAPGIPGALLGDVGLAGVPEFAMNDSGQLVFLAPLTGVPFPGNSAMFVGDAPTRTYSLLARTGAASPVPSGAPFSFITTPSINSRGDAAFFSNLSAAPFFGLFWKPAGGALQPAVSAGDPAPGFPAGFTISSFVGQNSGPPAFNDNGVFSIAGGVNNAGGGAQSFALWRGAPGALQLIAKKNDQAPGAQAGALFNDFIPLINRAGAVLFYSNLSAGAQNAGVWIAPPGQGPRLLTLLNTQAPGMPPGIVLQSISNGGIALNNRGEGLINSSMNYVVNSTPANGIFAGRPGRLRKVVASGDPLEVSPGVFRTPISILCWTNNGPDTGRQTSINDRGEIAFSCNFVGGGGATFIARLPDPCPGDATGDDVIDFIDLNVVLSQFGMVGPGLAGDLNGDSVVDFLDLNSVLSFFGAAC